MKKYFIPLIIAVSLFVWSGLVSKTNARENQLLIAAADSRSIITLSETELFIPCKIGYVPTRSCPDINSIYVGVRGNQNPDDGTESEIKYKVSGGRMIGEGSNVKWDFSEVRKAGNYVITVEFLDFENKKHTAFETIALRDCDCPNDNLAEANPTPTLSDLPEIEKIALDKIEVVKSCLDKEYDGKDLRIRVETTVRNPKNLPLIYDYTVSSGRIVGQGDKVVWDLKGARQGTYTITVAIDYGRGFINEAKSETVKVKECEFEHVCVCPAVDAVGGGNIRAGENVTFTAAVSGGTATDISYKWTISQGEIIAGQGTREITVKTTKEMSGTIEATVEVGAPGLCNNCRITASETATIIK